MTGSGEVGRECCGDRRRARRAWRQRASSASRGHAVTLYDKNDWLGGKAAVLEEAGFPLRHGPDHPHRAARLAPHLRRGRPRARGSARPDQARPAMALLLRRRYAHRSGRERRRRWRRPWTTSPPAAAPAIGAFLGSGAQPARGIRALLLLEAGRDHAGYLQLQEEPRPLDPARCSSACAWAARSPGPSARRSRTGAWRRCSTISPSMSAPRPTAHRRCSVRSPTCRSPRASGIRSAARRRSSRP